MRIKEIIDARNLMSKQANEARTSELAESEVA